MRVLWFAVTPSLYDERINGGWIASLERVVNQYSEFNIELGIAFEYPDDKYKVIKNGSTYYPINIKVSFVKNIRIKFSIETYWNMLRAHCLSIVSDFQPDIIHCFGSEWPFGAIVNDVNIPVVIHMQGFLNIYNYEVINVKKTMYGKFGLWNSFVNDIRIRRLECMNRFEQRIMESNRYFMGRTEWDKNIVKFYSPNSSYYYCPEAIRPEIFNSNSSWHFEKSHKMRIVTITQASALKGNKIILQTAKIMKDQFHFDFDWRVAGDPKSFSLFERETGINHKDVNITLLGMISAEKVVYELQSAEVYVNSSIIDNSPNSICEAQLIGCPVITSYVGGIPQLVENDISGIFYPYNEPHTLAFDLINIHNDQHRLEMLSKNEVEISKNRHNPHEIVKTLYYTYKAIVSNYKER